VLIEFSVTNFRSFREKQTLSMVAGRDTKHKESLVDIDGTKLLKAAAVYGANASGKSNLMSALEFVQAFVIRSATQMNQGDKIEPIVPFRLDAVSTKNPSSFQLAFEIGKDIYEYGFSATVDRVHDEWITMCPSGGRTQRWLDRKLDPVTNVTSWDVGGPLKPNEALLRERTRDNGLVLSRGAELNVEPLSRPFLWIRNNLLTFRFDLEPIALTRETALGVKKDAKFRARILKMLRDADLGISDMDVAEERPLKDTIPEPVKAMFTEKGLHEYLQNAEQASPSIHTIHRPLGSEKTVTFDFEDESRGTQRFFALAGPFLDALDNGWLVAVDELDCSMHPLLTWKLVKLFQSNANKRGAQLIFTTHDTSLMDPELLRRDQVWITEKNAEGATELRSLYDYREKSRSTEDFEKRYLAGRYGGIPLFGHSFEELDAEQPEESKP